MAPGPGALAHTRGEARSPCSPASYTGRGAPHGAPCTGPASARARCWREDLRGAAPPDERVRALADRTWVALCHYPVLNRQGRVVATAITNLDLHDIARACRTFGLSGFLVITPIERQRHLAERIVSHWRLEAVPDRTAHRSSAIALIRVVPDLDGAVALVASHHGASPVLVATSARSTAAALTDRRFVDERVSDPRPVLLVFGTGWGLAEAALDRAQVLLRSIEGLADYNHLSVRSAVSIYLDRLFGLRDQ